MKKPRNRGIPSPPFHPPFLWSGIGLSNPNAPTASTPGLSLPQNKITVCPSPHHHPRRRNRLGPRRPYCVPAIFCSRRPAALVTRKTVKIRPGPFARRPLRRRMLPLGGRSDRTPFPLTRIPRGSRSPCTENHYKRACFVPLPFPNARPPFPAAARGPFIPWSPMPPLSPPPPLPPPPIPLAHPPPPPSSPTKDLCIERMYPICRSKRMGLKPVTFLQRAGARAFSGQRTPAHPSTAHKSHSNARPGRRR